MKSANVACVNLKIAPALAALISTLFLSWPAAVNGGAFFFPDTSSYLRAADAALHVGIGWHSEWSDKYHLYEGQAALARAEEGSGPKAEAAAPLGDPVHPVLLGRSVYYGLAVLPLLVLIGSAGAILLQAACATMAIWLVLRAFVVDGSRTPILLVAVSLLLGSATSLPFFVSLLMPDLFAGLAVALAIAGGLGWSRFMRWEKACVTLLLVFSALAHSSNILLLLVLASAMGLLRTCTQSISTSGVIVLVFAALLGFSGERLFIAVVTEQTGEAPIRPPFLTARLIAAGPGQRLLEEKCPQLRFEVCRYAERGPQDSDTFLWSRDPRVGVFSAESHKVQRKLADEDFRFAYAVFRSHPFQLLRSSAEATTKQILLTKLDIFNAPRESSVAVDLPPMQAEEVRASRYESRTMPVVLSEIVSALSTVIGAILLTGLSMGVSGIGKGATQKVKLASGLFLFAIAANASITGTLSKPHNRYNARITWIIPLGAAVLLYARRRERKKEEQHGVQ